jgi:hypothetical protein
VQNASFDNSFGLEDFLLQPRSSVKELTGSHGMACERSEGEPAMPFRDSSSSASANAASNSHNTPPSRKDMKPQKSRNSLSVTEAISKVLSASSSEVDLAAGSRDSGM